MARGGIFDQIGGGFHRYSTDDKWLVPHFEKMLYDNALLMKVYLDFDKEVKRSGVLQQEPDTSNHSRHRYTADLIYEWIDSELRLPGFAYASSLDADSDGEEGKFYTWTLDEVHNVFQNEDDVSMICNAFDISSRGSLENRACIPNCLNTFDVRYSLIAELDSYSKRLDYLKQGLLNKRNQRSRPVRDDKALCDWNSLFISAQVAHGETAVTYQTADHFLTPFERDGELVHSFLGERELRVQLLTDYAALGNGLLDLFCATGELRLFDGAYKLGEEIERRFAKGDGLYYMSEDSVAGVRSVDLYDSALPSGNSLAGNLFIKLYYLTGEEKFRERAQKQMDALMPYLERAPTAFSQALLTAEWLVYPPEQVIVVYPHLASLKEGNISTHNRIAVHVDEKFVESLPEKHPLHTLIAGKAVINGKRTYYICRNFACELPITDTEQLKSALKKPWQK